MKRMLLIVMALLTLVSFGGCTGDLSEIGNNQLGAYSGSGETEMETVPARTSLSMVFYEDMDVNPLTTVNSENHELLKLVYSPLIRLDENLKPVYVLAGGVTAEGTRVTVVLREGLKFSDGSALTASDVAASFKTLRNAPNSPYYNRLENVQSWSVADDRTIVIQLREPQVDYISFLDLPVVKSGALIGCGPFKFGERNGKTVLVANDQYFEPPSIQLIELKAPKNQQERQNLFSVGLLDVYFESEETDPEFPGGRDYRVQTYAGDDLLYIGINCSKPLLQDAKVRHFLNQLLERQKLAEGVLLGQAKETAYPFQAEWYKAQGLTHQWEWTASEKKEAAAAAGLTLTENALLDSTGTQLTFSLLVADSGTVQQSVAKAVGESLALSGVKINVEVVSRADYQKRLETGEYELYLGEVKTGRTVNTALYAAGSSINYSLGSFPELEQAAAAYQSGEKELSAVAEAFDVATPVLPIAYRRGVLFTAADVGDFAEQGTWAVYGNMARLKMLEQERKKES